MAPSFKNEVVRIALPELRFLALLRNLCQNQPATTFLAKLESYWKQRLIERSKEASIL
jgi:hypothetical protein